MIKSQKSGQQVRSWSTFFGLTLLWNSTHSGLENYYLRSPAEILESYEPDLDLLAFAEFESLAKNYDLVFSSKAWSVYNSSIDAFNCTLPPSQLVYFIGRRKVPLSFSILAGNSLEEVYFLKEGEPYSLNVSDQSIQPHSLYFLQNDSSVHTSSFSFTPSRHPAPYRSVFFLPKIISASLFEVASCVYQPPILQATVRIDNYLFNSPSTHITLSQAPLAPLQSVKNEDQGDVEVEVKAESFLNPAIFLLLQHKLVVSSRSIVCSMPGLAIMLNPTPTTTWAPETLRRYTIPTLVMPSHCSKSSLSTLPSLLLFIAVLRRHMQLP